jgi:hypothetical protein
MNWNPFLAYSGDTSSNIRLHAIMPDPVLPVVGFALGCMAFLATVRNGIATILNDRDNFKQSGRDLVPLICEVAAISSRVNNWRRFWRFYDGVPKSLPTVYLGVQGGRRMLTLLASIDLASRQMRDEFRTIYAHIIYKTKSRTRHDGCLSESSKVSNEANEKQLERYIRRYKRWFGVSGKLSITLFRGSLFRKHLDNLAGKVKMLEDDSLFEFVHEWECDASEAQKNAAEVGTQFFLSHLATRSAKTSEALLELLSSVDNLRLDCPIDHYYGIEAERRKETLAARAGNGGFPYYVQLSRNPPASDALKIAIESVLPNDRKVWCSDFEQGVLSWRSSVSGDSLFMRPKSQTATFRLKRIDGWTHGSVALRASLSSTDPEDLLESLHGDFSKRNRVKLAYELAESALIFLKTKWYSRLCGCALHCVCVDELEEEYEFYFRTNNLHHLEPECGQTQPTKQWCEEELVNMHIQRLGVMLVEIALGTSVTEVAYNQKTRKVELDLCQDTSLPPDQVHDLPPRKIARRVEKAAGEDFSLAVDYCLRHGREPGEIGAEELERFYNKVVAPWVDHLCLPKMRLIVPLGCIFTTTNKSYSEMGTF